MNTNTTNQFIEIYKQAEARAVDCVGGRGGEGGKAFLREDRAMLVSEMWKINKTPTQLGYAIQKELGSPGKHTQRLRIYEAQVNSGAIRLGSKPTGEHVGKGSVTIQTKESLFDGRIKTIADVQPAFNRAARQLIKVGITNPAEAFKYVSMAFETAKVEQKIDNKAERIVKELQLGDLTKDQVLLTLERVKQSF